MAVVRILCWALIFIVKLRFPPGLSLTGAITEHYRQCVNIPTVLSTLLSHNIRV